MTINYKELPISGTSWQRAVRVIVENPYGQTPSIIFVEEEITTLATGKKINEPVGNVGCAMDPSSPLHGEIYVKLNELYTVLREARDTHLEHETLCTP